MTVSAIDRIAALLRGVRMRRRVAWVASLALLLNAATPLLASAAAAARGVPVGEVCEVGVPPAAEAPMAMTHADAMDDMASDASMAMHPPASDDGAGHASHHAHGGAHCGLTSLATLAPPGFALLPPIAATPPVADAPVVVATNVAFDAVARWTSRNKQGPPATRDA